ncbi:MAG: hypothetical protein EOO82_03860, partial [Oxalobacteraceae bacterium]
RDEVIVKSDSAYLVNSMTSYIMRWRSNGYADRKPAYRSAVANVAYAWRDGSPVDDFGPMPAKFAERRFELIASGLLLPAKAPVWACDPYRIWSEADKATWDTDDSSAVSAWHVIVTLPPEYRGYWNKLITDFADRHLVSKGAAIAYAIHACEGADGEPIVHPHAHLIVTARHWRHERRHGRRHPNWLGNIRQHAELRTKWRETMRALEFTMPD